MTTRANVYFPVMDTTGREIKGEVTIELRPGIGVVGPNGDHMEMANGPHTVSLAFAGPLLSSNRARPVSPDEAETLRASRRPAEPTVTGAPDGVVHRDPVPESREGRRRR